MNWATVINGILDKLGLIKLLYGLFLASLIIKFIPEDWDYISKTQMSYINIIFIFCIGIIIIDIVVRLYVYIEKRNIAKTQLEEQREESRQKDLDIQREMLIYLEENNDTYGFLFKYLLFNTKTDPNDSLIRILDIEHSERFPELNMPRKILPGGTSYIPYFTQSSNYRILKLNPNFLRVLKRYYPNND